VVFPGAGRPAHTHSNAHPYSNTHTHSNTHADSHTHAHTGSDSDRNSNAYPHPRACSGAFAFSLSQPFLGKRDPMNRL
jgi:hypothetical protein